jgi:hypothetical protein
MISTYTSVLGQTDQTMLARGICSTYCMLNLCEAPPVKKLTRGVAATM